MNEALICGPKNYELVLKAGGFDVCSFFSMKGFLFMSGKNARILFWDQSQCEMLNTTIFQYQNLCFFLSDKKKNKRNLKNEL